MKKIPACALPSNARGSNFCIYIGVTTRAAVNYPEIDELDMATANSKKPRIPNFEFSLSYHI
jgi:hypothetical protein